MCLPATDDVRAKAPMNTLVTGANGLLGSHVTEIAKERGDQVRVVLMPTEPAERLTSLGVEICRGDPADPETPAQAVQGVDVILHCASRKGPWGRREDYERVNVKG